MNTKLNIKNDATTEQLIIPIPETTANLQLPDPALLNYYQDKEERILWVDSEISESVIEISKTIIDINRADKNIPEEERKPIKIMIYSYGGDLNACLHLIDTMLISKTPIYTYNMGVAMSAGLIIFLAGHKRYCLARSQALIHSGSGGASGSFEAAGAQMKNYEKLITLVRNFILERTNIDQKLFNKKKSQEWYIYADEQVSLGIANEIITNIDALL